MADELVSCKQQDFLEQDPEIRGQKFFCMSTISPEDVLVKKDVFFLHKFLGHLSEDLSVFFNNMYEKFSDNPEVTDMLKNIKERYGYISQLDELSQEFHFFKSKNNVELEEQFHAENKFQTSIRGVKIRGVYDNLHEARNRAEKLSKIDKTFNIFIGQVGCWCPWSPYADHIEDQEYAETQLNTLMKKYKETAELRDQIYDQRTKELVSAASASKQPGFSAKIIEEEDPWTADKQSGGSSSQTK